MTRSGTALCSLALFLAAGSAMAVKPCEELKTEIAAHLDAKGVTHYTLDIVGKDEAADQKIVGSCAHGTQQIVYRRN